MFTYEVSVLFLGQLIDNIRVSANNALDACNEISENYRSTAFEIIARRVTNKDTVSYSTYFNDLVILDVERYYVSNIN